MHLKCVFSRYGMHAVVVWVFSIHSGRYALSLVEHVTIRS